LAKPRQVVLGLLHFHHCPKDFSMNEDSLTGTVKFFNASKGYGFITADGGEEIFFHQSNVKETGFRDMLRQGDLVTFEIKNGQKGKRAVNIFRKATAE
jgi:cold shock protein